MGSENQEKEFNPPSTLEDRTSQEPSEGIKQLEEFLSKPDRPYLANIFLMEDEALANQPPTKDRGHYSIWGGKQKEKKLIEKNKTKLLGTMLSCINSFKTRLSMSLENERKKQPEYRDHKTLFGVAITNMNKKNLAAIILQIPIGRPDTIGRNVDNTLIFFMANKEVDQIVEAFRNQQDIPKKLTMLQHYIDPQLPILQPPEPGIHRATFGRVEMKEGWQGIDWLNSPGYEPKQEY